MRSWLCVVLAALPQNPGDSTGAALFRIGKYPEAAAMFRAEAAASDDALHHYNLALASWRAGELEAAELAIEKYAALAGRPRVDLHAGLLGAIRFDEAQGLAQRADGLLQPAAPPSLGPGTPGGAPQGAEDPLPLFEQALAKVDQAREHFVRGAVAGPSPELVRNTERALRFRDELQRKIEALQKQREQQKQDQKQDSKQDQKDGQKQDAKDDSKPDPNQQQKSDQPQTKDPQQKQQEGGKPPEADPAKQDPAKPSEGQQQGQSGKPPEESPQPKPDGKGEAGEPKEPDAQPPKPESGTESQPPSEAAQPNQKPAAKPSAPRRDAPGEQAEGRELAPEQAQKLQQALREADQALREYRLRATRSARRSAERDW
jgi:hypothetical protein